jgi:hypothetical protein
VTHEGWFLFCPIWITEYRGDVMPIPKYKLEWLFNLALWCQQAMNWIHSATTEEGGGFEFRVKECQPFEIQIPDFAEA